MTKRGKILLIILIVSIIIAIAAIIYVGINYKEYILLAVLLGLYFISYPSCICYLYDFTKKIFTDWTPQKSFYCWKIWNFALFLTLLIPMVASLLYFRDYMHNRIDNKNEVNLYDTYN